MTSASVTAPVAAPGSALRTLRLTADLGRAVTGMMAAELGDVELAGNSSVGALCALELRGPLQPRDLQRLTGLSSGGVTKLLDRLEASRLVEREYDAVPGDRRAVLVRVTPEGHRAARRLAAALDDHADALRALLAELRDLFGGAVMTEAPGPSRERSLERVLLVGRLGAEIRAALADTIVFDPGTAHLELQAICELRAEGPLRPRELRERLGLSTGGMTKLTDRLVARRLVERARGPVGGDRRATLITLTASGGDVVDQFGARLETHREALRSLVAEIEGTFA